MTEFRDPTGWMRAAAIGLCAYILLRGLFAILLVAAPGDSRTGPVAIAYLVALFVCYILVGGWIYRANANAHVFSSEMTITPGWAIGWFFVPFGNLIMPYEGVKETWEQSHRHAGLYRDAEDYWLLRWWWGLWLASNILTYIISLFRGADPDAAWRLGYANLLAAAGSCAAGVVLILIMRSICRAQLVASRGSVFA